MSITYHLKKVLQRIKDAINKNYHIAHPVTLLAVSKTHNISKIEEAYQAGQRDFGENYLQEAMDKIAALKDFDICWHYIGPIQSNKTTKIAENFHWVHSVDRLKIAQRLSDQRPRNLPPLKICLQVNISNEMNKSGVHVDELPALLEAIHDFQGIIVKGLMCIPTKAENFEQQRQAFHKMQKLYQQHKLNYPSLDTLSMGMSADLEAAIAEGSTIVRVGTDIFGARNKPAVMKN
ncbi:MAG: YggS family pyridoxal phosphate-dependent enzyme [Gammaproteobacteria bacterium]|nr:YggS family pyridoxal phosphate-dependent enzyme [Gammaproteobacteria bacterium]